MTPHKGQARTYQWTRPDFLSSLSPSAPLIDRPAETRTIAGMTTAIIPTFFIQADNIPQAHYRATKTVFERAMQIRTQYDRKNPDGSFLDPPSRDARVMIHVVNPFNQPRYPMLGFSEIGVYIAEILGIKDHLVIDFGQLKEQLQSGRQPTSTFWPYTYHQRLFSHPFDGKLVDQIERALDRLAHDQITRRAIATTRLPGIDSLLKEDIPCLSEVHLRCAKQDGALYLCMTTYWRSRDLFKAWHDNVIGLTFMQQCLAAQLAAKLGRPVKVGDYAEVNSSLHIYGQDMLQPSGAAATAVKHYLDIGEAAVVARAFSSDDARDLLVVPQLEELLSDEKIKEWHFGKEQLAVIGKLIADLKEGKLTA